MLESMTGAASGTFSIQGMRFEIWARSVNHRFFELQLRIPRVLESQAHQLGAALEEEVRARLSRGRVEIEVQLTAGGGGGTSLRRLRYDAGLAGEYRQLVLGLAAAGKTDPKSGAAGRQTLSPGEALELLRMPGVVEIEQALPESFDRERFLREFGKVLERLLRSRRQEGRGLARILKAYLKEIEAANRGVRKRYGQYRKEKLASIRRDLRLSSAGPPDPLRAAVDWLDRGDISEELERVALHCAAMRGLLSGTTDDAGKQIEFYAQELLREVNTIGSKARDFATRQLVVDMKTRIEKIKEQIRNVC